MNQKKFCPDLRFTVENKIGDGRWNTEISVLHNQAIDEYYITQYGITTHLKLFNGCCLLKTVT